VLQTSLHYFRPNQHLSQYVRTLIEKRDKLLTYLEHLGNVKKNYIQIDVMCEIITAVGLFFKIKVIWDVKLYR
jgi:hypothetical protein